LTNKNHNCIIITDHKQQITGEIKMSIQFVKPLDSQTIYNSIQKRIIEAKFNYALWKKIEKIIEKFDGKQLNKRIDTALKNALPEYTIYANFEYTMFKVTMWGNGIDYNDRKTFYLGYHSHPYLDMVKVKESNMSFELEEQRAKNLEEVTLKAIEEKVNIWNEALTKMQSCYKWAEGFEIQYTSYGFDLNLR
jgi:hypothetical protein